MNLRNRILLVLLAVSLVFTVALGWLVYRDSVRHMEQELAREAEQIASLSTQRLIQQQERLSAEARLLAEFPEVKGGLEHNDSRSLQRIIGVVVDAARIDMLLVQRPDGDVLASWTVNTTAAGLPTRTVPPMPGRGMLLMVGDELSQAVAEPVHSGDGAIGYVTAGALLNQDFLDDVSRSSEANLVLFLDNRPYRGTSSLGDDWEAIRQWSQLPGDAVRLGRDEWQVVVSAPLALVSERVRLGVLLSRTEYRQQMHSVRNNTMLAVLGAALVLGMAGLIFANRLVAPLARLTDAARRVAAGERGVPVPGGGVGEIADLSVAFNTMVQAVQSRDAELQRRMGDLQALREGASDAIFILDLDGRIRSANSKACEWTGRPLAVLEGMNLFDVLHMEENRPSPSKAAAVGIAAKKNVWQIDGGVFQAALEPPGGERVPVEISGGLVPGVDPPVIQLFARDLRERQSLQDQLLQAQKLEAIGTLAGGIAHDFNNLLTGIGGHAQLARMDLPLEHPAQESLAVVEEAVERGANLCRQLLGAARKGRREVRRVNLNTVVEEAVHLCQQTFSPAIGWDIRLAGPLPGVQADAGQVHQVLMNLLVNARDAIGDNQGLLTLVTATGPVGADHALVRSGQLAEGAYVTLTVMDSGMGIPHEHLARIFDPFFTTKEAGKGTGLGLSTVFGILREHGGAIEVSSRAGKGTAFTCFFPAEDSPVPLAEASETPDLAAPPAVARRILVVDDEESIRELIHSVLGTCGHQVVMAENGLRAMDLLDSMNGAGMPDLAVLDMLMPGMNGRDTALALRRRIPGLPILFITGYMGEDTNLEIPGGPPPRLVNKPFRTAQLIATINEMLAAPDPATDRVTSQG